MNAVAMEEFSGKRAANGVPRKGSSLVLREKSDINNNKDQNGQFCNRIGCSGRLHYSRGTAQTPCSDKPKSVRTTFRSAGKEMIAGTSSSKTLSAVTNSKRTFHPSHRNVSNKLELDSTTDRGSSSSSISSSSSNASVHDKSDVSEEKDAESSKNQSSQAGSSSAVASNPKSRRILRQKSVLGNQDAQLNSSVSSSTSASKSAGHGASSKNGLRSLRCNLASDVIPQASFSESYSRGKELARKRITERESSLSIKGKKLSGPTSVSSSSSVSIPESSRRNKNWASSREISASASSVRTRRSMNSSTRLGRPNQVNAISSPSGDPPVRFSRANQIESTVDGNVSDLTGESSSSRSSAYILPSNDSNRLHNSIRTTSMEHGIARLANRDGLQQYNMDGIAEVLLALERIEQNEELTYEQLLVLESNLFLGGLSFYDQHRDMRLDIDNMSYEDLLALEEKMGNVSTALSEEALINCLKTSVYNNGPLSEVMGDGDVTKCSICQEEYADGDEIGRLGCEHGYHASCIQHWLRLKNWCPICKGSAAPPSASASLMK